MKNLEFGAAVRYDHYSDFGSTTNAKGTFRWTPARNLLVRGSVGTGFHAPTVPQINAATQSYGVTVDNYDCSPDLQTIATSLGAQCRPNNQQYDQFAGGNKDLKPEKSRQATLGLRFEPTNQYSLGADFWWVAIKDAFGQITEQDGLRESAQVSEFVDHFEGRRDASDLPRLPRQQPEPGQAVLLRHRLRPAGPVEYVDRPRRTRRSSRPT